MSDDAKSLNKNANLVGILTGLSRIFGLVREMLTSRLIGTSLEQSAFVFAFTLPNLFRKLFGEGALSSAFIPVFNEELKSGRPEEARRIARAVASMVFMLLATICLVGIMGMSIALPYFPEGGKVNLVMRLARIMLPYSVLICVAAFAGGMLNSLGQFGKAAFAPALLNIVWIATLIGLCFFPELSMYERVRTVAWSVLASGLMQMAYLLHAAHRNGMGLRLSFSGWRNDRVRLVWRNTFTGAIGMGAVQINLVLDNALAVWAAPWAAAAISYAERIVYLPLGVVATAFATVLLPTFSSCFTAKDETRAAKTLIEATEDVLLLMIPAALGLIMLSTDIVDVIYGGGKFTAEDTVRVSRALAFYAPGLLVFSVNKILTPWFYAKKDMKTPVRVGLYMVGANAVLNIILVLALPVDWKHVGIAGSTVVCSLASCIVLASKTRYDGKSSGIGFRTLMRPAADYLIAGIFMCAIIWGSGLTLPFFGDVGRKARAAILAARILIGAASYIVAVYVLRPGPLQRVLALGRRRPHHGNISRD